MRQANTLRTVEHHQPNQVIKVAVEEWQIKAEFRKTFEECVSTVGRKRHLKRIIAMPHRALVVVPLCAKLRPMVLLSVEPAAKIHALVCRSVDVTGPEQREVASREHGLVCHALERHVEIMRGDELKLRPAFDVKRRCRRLV